MHIGAVMIFAPRRQRRAISASRRRARSPARRAAALPPAALAAADRRPELAELGERTTVFDIARSRPPGARCRRRAAAGAARLGRPYFVAAPRPHAAAVGDGRRRGARGRPLGARHQDPPLHGRRRRLGRREHPAARHRAGRRAAGRAGAARLGDPAAGDPCRPLVARRRHAAAWRGWRACRSMRARAGLGMVGAGHRHRPPSAPRHRRATTFARGWRSCSSRTRSTRPRGRSLNVPIGGHRRLAVVARAARRAEGDQDGARRQVNDVVLAASAGGLRRAAPGARRDASRRRPAGDGPGRTSAATANGSRSATGSARCSSSCRWPSPTRCAATGCRPPRGAIPQGAATRRSARER